jgi:putative transposase
MVGAPARRQQVAFAQKRGLSQRRACALYSTSRSTLRYVSRLEARDEPLLAVMTRLAEEFPRFGYRRIQILMERQGYVMGPDKAFRLWNKAGLQVPRKRLRKRVAHSRPRPQLPSGANEVWAYDFVHDACANGQQIKCLTIIDEYTRECLAIDVAGSIRSNRVIEVLSRLVSKRGTPRHLRSDNGPEFVSKALLRWAADQDLGVALIDPGKPWQNGMVESFNGKFRDECLSMEWFRSRVEAKVVIEGWRKLYNEVRPHSSLGKMTPDAFAQMIGNNENQGATLKN